MITDLFLGIAFIFVVVGIALTFFVKNNKLAGFLAVAFGLVSFWGAATQVTGEDVQHIVMFVATISTLFGLVAIIFG